MAHPLRTLLAGAAVILRARWQVARNMFWRRKPLHQFGTLVLLALALLVSYGLYRLSGRLVEVLASEEPAQLAQLGDVSHVLGAVPGIAFATATAPLLLQSISFALATLYLANDLDLLLVAPVPMRAVFLARFVEGLLPIYAMLFVLFLPSLAGYGVALGYGPGYAVALLLALLLLPLLPMSLGVLLTMVLVRITPAKRLRELMTVLGGLLGIAAYIGTQLLDRTAGRVATVEAGRHLLQLDLSFLPTSWASRALFGAATGDLEAVLRYGLPYLVVTLGLWSLVVTLSERLYYAGWANIAGAAGGRVRRRDPRGRGGSWLRGSTGVILLKDLRMLPRDLQRLSQLLLPFGLSLFWAWQLVTGRGSRSTGGVMAGLTIIALVVCVLLTSHLGLTGVSHEGRAYWLLHLAPIGPWPVLRAKTLVAFLPFPIVGTLFTLLIGVLREPPLGELLQAWAVVLMTGVGVSGITTGFGASYPRFDWTQPHRMNTFRAGCLAPIAYNGYAGLMLLLTTGAERLARRWGTVALITGWSVAALLTLFALLVPLWFAATKLRRLEF